jgi:hypothetical protein
LYSSADVESSTDLGGLFELDWELEESIRTVVLDAAFLNPCERRRVASDIMVLVMGLAMGSAVISRPISR